MEPNGKVNGRPSQSAKCRFKEKLRKLTNRKRSGTFYDIITKINQMTVGWINYYGISNYEGIHNRNSTMVKSSIKTMDMEEMETSTYHDIKCCGNMELTMMTP
ncbi:group II intron maturase-specific domain-containing protein [Amphibacillus sp. Q70]|uniref:group II intron maturase-specific domain-containing protein n=1 Tax=Amphibacillus sp. Q70 TaxID=3453416 RepID=UPI003F856FB6